MPGLRDTGDGIDVDPPLSDPLAKREPPSYKSTVPVAAEGETVTVKVNDWPNVDGFAEEATVVDVAVWDPVIAVSVTSFPVPPI